MKIAFVAGFFDPVWKALEKTFKKQIETGAIVWIRQLGMNREVNLKEFSERFNQAVSAGDGPFLVLLTVLRNREFVVTAVERLAGRARATGIQVDILTTDNAGNRAMVLAELATFGLPDEPEISAEKVRAKVTKGRVLCVSLDGKTPITTALRRVGFSELAIAECFEEEVLVGARYSDFNRYIEGKASKHSYLLYAWHGLRTTTPETKKAFSDGCAEAPTAHDVAMMFKKWILECL